MRRAQQYAACKKSNVARLFQRSVVAQKQGQQAATESKKEVSTQVDCDQPPVPLKKLQLQALLERQIEE